MSKPINRRYPLFLRDLGKGGAATNVNIDKDEIINIVNQQKGYPKVEVEGGTGIIMLNANANIFYDIKNTPDDVIAIQPNIFEANNINGELFIMEVDDIEGLEVIFPDFPEEAFDEIKMQIIATLSMIIVTKQNNKYKLYVYMLGEDIKELTEVDNLDVTDLEIEMEGMVLTAKNIKFIEPNYNLAGYPIYLEEVENDNPEYTYKYKVVNNIMVMVMGLDVYYSNTPLEELTYMDIEDMQMPLIKDNFKSLYDKNVGEFVFNFNTPVNIQIMCNWNNGEIPDYSQEGLMTISVVNNIGTYTFVPS